MENKNNKIIIILMGLIIVILAVLCILFATNVLSFNLKTDNNCVNNNKNNEIVQDEQNNVIKEIDSDVDEEIDADKLYEIGKGYFSSVKRIYYGDDSFSITPEGKVLIGFEDYINGLNKVKDIIIFDSLENGANLYILDYSGQLYKYDLENIKTKNFEVQKQEQYNNIKKIFEYQTLKKNAGGCMRLVVIDEDNNYKEVDSNCV